jgi:hypothetical protein
VVVYQRDGWELVEGLVDLRRLDVLFETVASLLALHDGLPAPTGGWSDGAFQGRMQRLRLEDPRAFGLLYDAVSVSAALASATTVPAVVDAASSLLRDRVLAATGAMVRMDPPGDIRNRLEWHQECSYYTQNADPGNGLVVWFPLHDHQPEHGPVEVRTGSHVEGHIEPEAEAGGALVSEQYRVPDAYVEGYPSHAVVARPGDVLFFDMRLFHRSGINVSDEIRFSGGVRFHRMTSGDFTPGRFLYSPS